MLYLSTEIALIPASKSFEFRDEKEIKLMKAIKIIVKMVQLDESQINNITKEIATNCLQLDCYKRTERSV